MVNGTSPISFVVLSGHHFASLKVCAVEMTGLTSTLAVANRGRRQSALRLIGVAQA
jgi:hypothetical protein